MISFKLSMQSESDDSLFKLWVELSRTRVSLGDFWTPPWESLEPRVIDVWERLTAPENTNKLMRWQEEVHPANPASLEVTNKAIEHCREKMSSSSNE